MKHTADESHNNSFVSQKKMCAHIINTISHFLVLQTEGPIIRFGKNLGFIETSIMLHYTQMNHYMQGTIMTQINRSYETLVLKHLYLYDNNLIRLLLYYTSKLKVLSHFTYTHNMTNKEVTITNKLSVASHFNHLFKPFRFTQFT